MYRVSHKSLEWTDRFWHVGLKFNIVSSVQKEENLSHLPSFKGVSMDSALKCYNRKTAGLLKI